MRGRDILVELDNPQRGKWFNVGMPIKLSASSAVIKRSRRSESTPTRAEGSARIRLGQGRALSRRALSPRRRRSGRLKIAIIGQQDFGKAVLEAFLARGDTVAGVFIAPEKEGAKADPMKVAAQEKGLKVFQFASLKSPEAAKAMKDLDADIGIMAFVLQFAPQEFVKIPKHGTSYHPPRCCLVTGPSRQLAARARREKQTGLTIFGPQTASTKGR